MAPVADTAVSLIEASLSKSTQAAYNNALLDFHKFTQVYGTPYGTGPPNPGHLVLFIAHMFNKGLASATITSKISALAYFYRLLGHQEDITTHFLVQKSLAGTRKLCPAVDARLPITPQILTSLMYHTKDVTDCPYHIALLRAMVSMAFLLFSALEN